MSELAMPATELLAWVDKTGQTWKGLLEKHPGSLELSCDIAGAKNVGELLRHIVVVELRFAEWLTGGPETPHEQILSGSVEEIYANHDRALQLMRELLAKDGLDWSQEMEFRTRKMGTLKAARSVFFFHPLLHAVRHYAQLATLLRPHGITPDWPMDYLWVAARRV